VESSFASSPRRSRVDFAVALERAERRDLHLLGSADEVRRRYLERYLPAQRLYLDSVRPERWASVVVDNDDPLRPRPLAGLGPRARA
jgi:uridine kinase